jgi:alpha-maltose-1-phosphate synthase
VKIVIVSKEFPPSPHSYGIGTYTQETSLSLARLGHEVTVVCAADAGPREETMVQGVRVIRLPDEEFSRRSPKSHLVAPVSTLTYRKLVAETLDRIIANGKAEIVEFPGYRGESFVWARGRRKIPMVVRMHGFTGWVYKSWRDHVSAARRQLMRYETAELLNADCVTLVADHLRKDVEKRISRERVITLYNGINARRWADQSVAKETPDVSSKDILFVGSLTKIKGIFTLLQAVEKLRKRGCWKGRLVLFGRMDKEFSRYAAKHWGNGHSPPEYIDIRGQVSRDLLPPAYRNAGVCCFPSFRDPFNYTAIEATASGGLIVGSLGTGMEELILNQETGFLLPPGNPDKLCAALAHALSLNTTESFAMRQAAQNRVFSNFDQDVLTRQLVALYETQILGFSKRAG